MQQSTNCIVLEARALPDLCLQVMHSLLTALAGLHARGIAHGAVTADSLYVVASKTEEGQRTYDVKLVDFTSAVQFGEGEKVCTDVPASHILLIQLVACSRESPRLRIL